jgi:hypothetical protein
MPRYRITTLVDITRTNATRSETDGKRIAQQANFNSLVQAIGMRANVEWREDPVKHDGRLPAPWQGKAAHWCWEFEVERDQVFERDNDAVCLLREDLHGVPVIDGLNNSEIIDPAMFQTKGNKINIWICELA